ncbi:MAG TPA: flagellar filament capping protein FliD, partial [Steroidobacteraceae bacterium]|nr:flagellar filament capping protein FliD [Steroidobacteraceae bacterium]
AADASFSIGGVPYTSSSNTVTSALSGVTVTLLGKTTGSGANLTVASDTTTIQKNVAAFVSAYNTLQGALAPLGSFDAATQTAGPMLGNPVLMGVQSQLRHIMDSFVGSSSYNSLASIGIAAQNDGTLTLNTATLSTALATNFSAVSKLFSGTNGVATQLDSQITQDLASTGSIGDYATTLTKQSNALTKQSDDLQAQTNALQATLTQQYSALNTLLSSLQTTSSYLTQAFAALPQVQSKSNA